MTDAINPTIKNLSKIRCKYIPVPDRIRVTGELEDKSNETFLLTRRMLSQILPHVVGYIEKQAGKQLEKLLADVRLSLAKAQQEPDEIRWSDAKNDKPDTLDTQDTHDKLVELAESSDLSMAADSADWLVVKVNMAPTAAGCRLVFVGEQEQQACLTLRLPALCRWLVVLHSQCQQAQWELQQWPSWIHTLNVPQMPSSAVVLH